MSINFFSSAADLGGPVTVNLPGHDLSSAVLPRTFQLPFADRRVSDCWLKSLAAGNHREAAASIIASVSVSEHWTLGQMATTLQHAAQVLLSVNAVSEANRCLQESIAFLASSRDCLPADLEIERWVTLSAMSLARNDAETAGLWLRQSSRTLTGHAQDLPLAGLNHYLGDILAIQACIRFAPDDYATSVSLLSEAHRAHLIAGSPLSATLDLLMQSRCHRNENRSIAGELLHEATSTIQSIEPSRHETATHCRLARLIHDDLKQLRSTKNVVVAAWN